MSNNFESRPGIEALENLRSAPTTILEIGPGIHPSVDQEAATFYSDDTDVTYIGLELPGNVGLLEQNKTPNPVVGNAKAIPLRDETVDLVLMKSIFGQFTGSGDSHIDDIRLWGLYEVSRVLKPGGLIAIFEENTPWYEGYIEDYLRNVGMVVLDIIYKTDE